MSVSSTPSTSAAGGAGAVLQANLMGAQKTLSQDDFLKLLVAQLSSQDPLNPTSETDFTAQMAQFSSLEQTKSMQAQLVTMREQQEFLQANNLLGRTVALQTGEGEPVTGLVTGLTMVAGKPEIVVNGGSYELSSVLSVTAQPILA